MPPLHRLAEFFTVPWRSRAAVRARIGYDLNGLGPNGAGRPGKLMDPALHRHAAKAIYRAFGDDPFWSILVATIVYVRQCRSVEEIDRVVGDHAESRAGAFPADLYRGQGWDPARALWFLDDRAEFWRAYCSPGGGEWTTNEHCLDPGDRWRRSGYRLLGRRGCVQAITLEQQEDERQTASVSALAHSFALAADRLIRHACGAGAPEPLRDAIQAHSGYDGVIGPAGVAFTFTGANRQDWTNPPAVSFTLALTWRPTAPPHAA